jgi:Ribosome receptor lysine/proline rich region
MNKDRGSKHSKKRSKKSSKKSKKHKRSSYEDYSSDERSSSNKKAHTIKSIVEYSDVSSEDLSEPEAGEITDESGSASLYGNKANDVVNKGTGKQPVPIAEKRDSVGSASGVHKLHQSLINASPISSTHSPNQVSMSSDSRPLPLDEIASPSPLPPDLAEEDGEFHAL